MNNILSLTPSFDSVFLFSKILVLFYQNQRNSSSLAKLILSTRGFCNIIWKISRLFENVFQSSFYFLDFFHFFFHYNSLGIYLENIFIGVY